MPHEGELHGRPSYGLSGRVDAYRPRDANAVRAGDDGDASESAIVAQLVPAAEIH